MNITFAGARTAQKFTSDLSGIDALLLAASASSPNSADNMTSTERGGSEESFSTSPHRSAKQKSPEGGRAPRPTYTQEQEDFIWFHRDDLMMSWKQVQEAFNNQFCDEGKPKRTISGLQSRYYRILEQSVKERKDSGTPKPEMGLICTCPERRYPWMGADPEGRVKKNIEGQWREGMVEEYSDEDEEYGEYSEEENKQQSRATSSDIDRPQRTIKRASTGATGIVRKRRLAKKKIGTGTGTKAATVSHSHPPPGAPIRRAFENLSKRSHSALPYSSHSSRGRGADRTIKYKFVQIPDRKFKRKRKESQEEGSSESNASEREGVESGRKRKRAVIEREHPSSGERQNQLQEGYNDESDDVEEEETTSPTRTAASSISANEKIDEPRRMTALKGK